MTGCREKTVDAAQVAALEAAGYPRLLARLLALRGIADAAAAEAFFSPRMAGLLGPERLPGIAAVADTVEAAVRARRAIVIFGDYDCDGISATAILVKTLRALVGAEGVPAVTPFLPDRLSEGYGMSEAGVARMLKENPDVGCVVTVDNGINSVQAIAELKARGIAVAVTDHHLPGETLPDCPIANPKVAAPEELSGLCGAGVAFLLANELTRRAKADGRYSGPSLGGPLLVLAGLATVTDVMPLTGQNRILVAEALRIFPHYAPIGLRELHQLAARRAFPTLATHDFGFLIGPRINAAGRVASGMDALALILEEDREKARELARRVDAHNFERKTVELKMSEDALARIAEGASAQVIDLPGGHPGVAGIVAARVLEKLARPAPVCVVVDGRGSARAPNGFNVRDALAASSEALERFGGHAAAAGFQVREGQLDRFRELFAAAAEAQLASGGVAADDECDAVATAKELQDLSLAERIAALAPFGEGNDEPKFLVKGARLADVKTLGMDAKHLALTVDGVRSVWWGKGDRAEELHALGGRGVDVLVRVEVSDWHERHVEFRLVDIGQ